MNNKVDISIPANKPGQIQKGYTYMDYYAHKEKYGADINYQPLSDHLKQVQKIAEDYGDALGSSHLAGLAGILHDAGKYTIEFQEYLLEISNAVRGEIDHSTAGAQLLDKWFSHKTDTVSKMTLEVVQHSIISHHSELKDVVTIEGDTPFAKRLTKDISHLDKIEMLFFQEVMNRNDLEAYFEEAVKEMGTLLLTAIKDQLSIMEHPTKQMQSQRMRVHATLITKTVFSLLLDADRTDARLFSEQKTYEPKTNQVIFEQYQVRLEEYISTLTKKANQKKQTAKEVEINQLRQKMSDTCFQAGIKPTGIYQLSIPTGGGKTLASLRFAISHALEHEKEQIIYVIPYTSIIEQNAEEVKNILKDQVHILEHHSNFVETNGSKGEWYLRKMQMENWDAPIIFTTMVQYLDILYNNKGRNARRYHRLQNSVIIFDEVQSVPSKTLHLFNESLNHLKYVAKSTAVLCTATQPALSYVKRSLIGMDGDLVKLTKKELSVFKRVTIEVNLQKKWSNQELVERMRKECENKGSVLAIFNTKKTAEMAYQSLEGNIQGVQVYYLTTSMCAAHRLAVIKKMKESLEHNEKIICISTSLIEAGVNISFHVVFRSVAGLDSLAQAAGRCNRHGELGAGLFIVYGHQEDYLDFSFELKTAQSEAYTICRQLANTPERLLHADMMQYYFRSYYQRLSDNFLNYPVSAVGTNLYELLFSNNNRYTVGTCPYMLRAAHQTVGFYFKPIDQDSTAVLVPYGEGVNYINELKQKDPTVTASFYKKTQRFTINLYENQFKELKDTGKIEEIAIEGAVFYILLDDVYHDVKGLDYGSASANLK